MKESGEVQPVPAWVVRMRERGYTINIVGTAEYLPDPEYILPPREQGGPLSRLIPGVVRTLWLRRTGRMKNAPVP